MSRRFGRLLVDGFERFFGALAATEGAASRSPALDLTESERGDSVELDMPGVADDVKVTIVGRHVTVEARGEHEQEKKNDRIVWRERSMSSHARSFSLPMEVDQVASGARLENGVLTLTLPRRGTPKTAQIKVA